MPRGRTYVRNGSVIDLAISEGSVSALVMGSSLYKVAVVAAGTNMQRSGRSGNADEFWTSSPEVAIDFGLKAGAFQTSI
jgi:hypothetical protein